MGRTVGAEYARPNIPSSVCFNFPPLAYFPLKPQPTLQMQQKWQAILEYSSRTVMSQMPARTRKIEDIHGSIRLQVIVAFTSLLHAFSNCIFLSDHDSQQVNSEWKTFLGLD